MFKGFQTTTSKWQKKEIKKNKQTNKTQGIKRKNKIIEKDKQKNTKTGKKQNKKDKNQEKY